MSSHTQRITWQDFSLFLRTVRLKQGLSQERLAKLLGCDRTYIWRLENRNDRRPSRVFLRHLAGTCTLSRSEMAQLAGFESLRMYHCDDIDVELRL